MLILTRRSNESVVLTVDGRRIEVHILGLQGSQVKVGLKAGSDVKIVRGEIENVKKGENHDN